MHCIIVDCHDVQALGCNACDALPSGGRPFSLLSIFSAGLEHDARASGALPLSDDACLVLTGDQIIWI